VAGAPPDSAVLVAGRALAEGDDPWHWRVRRVRPGQLAQERPVERLCGGALPRSPSPPTPRPAACASTASATNHTDNCLSLSMCDTSVSITREVTTFQRLCLDIRPAIRTAQPTANRPPRAIGRSTHLAFNGLNVDRALATRWAWADSSAQSTFRLLQIKGTTARIDHEIDSLAFDIGVRSRRYSELFVRCSPHPPMSDSR
jgi:hypothetical protein